MGLPLSLSVLRSLRCLVIIQSFLKLCFLIRIFVKLSFLVQMLMNVARDLQLFLIFFFIVVATFTVLIQVVSEELHDEGGGEELEMQTNFFILALRQIIGDFDTSTMVEGTKFKNIMWVVWFLMMMVGNVVFMNFLIAVVSESYEKCI
jgi:hypothetical protein